MSNGNGAFAGVTGGGTWKTAAQYLDGTDAGVWTLEVAKE